jgi:hypothetical protein
MRNLEPTLPVMMFSACGSAAFGTFTWLENIRNSVIKRYFPSPRGRQLLPLVMTTLARGML